MNRRIMRELSNFFHARCEWAISLGVVNIVSIVTISVASRFPDRELVPKSHGRDCRPLPLGNIESLIPAFGWL